MSAPQPGSSPYLAVEFQLPEDGKKYREFIAERERNTASILNAKEDGRYETVETNTAERWFSTGTNPKRAVLRKCYTFGASPVAPIPHGLTNVTQYTVIRGIAITGAPANDQRPIPYTSVTNATAGIEINVGAANINIINGATAPPIVSGIVVLEYLKQ
jgi:hypothetical protein